jgi:hypothetical protein
MEADGIVNKTSAANWHFLMPDYTKLAFFKSGWH